MFSQVTEYAVMLEVQVFRISVVVSFDQCANKKEEVANSSHC